MPGPFLTIWTQPRATIRKIVDTDPRRHVLALAAIGSALGVLFAQWSAATMLSAANQAAFWPIEVALFAGLGAGLGIVVLYMNGAVFRWSGSLLGGTATAVEVRAALAWGQIPGIAGAAIGLAALLMFGGSGAPEIGAAGLPRMTPQFGGLTTVQVLFGIWEFIVSLECLGEVHRFSAWRALGAILIPVLFVVAGIGVVIFLASVALHGAHP